MRFRAKRLYDDPEPGDGTRLLVDGIWPRGVPREQWPDSTWRRDLAPSRQLREWYRHAPDRFDGFVARYRAELAGNAAVDEILAIVGAVTLVTATRDLDRSHAAVLAAYLEARDRGGG